MFVLVTTPDGESQDALSVALAEELLAGSVGPESADVPGSARIGDVSALDGDLEDEVAILFTRQIHLAGLLVPSEDTQKLSLASNVRGQDEVPDNVLHFGVICWIQGICHSGFSHHGNGSPPVVVLQYRGIVVEPRQVT